MFEKSTFYYACVTYVQTYLFVSICFYWGTSLCLSHGIFCSLILPFFCWAIHKWWCIPYLIEFLTTWTEATDCFFGFISDDTSEDGAWGKDEGTSARGDEAGWFSLTSPESRHRYMYFMMFKGQLTCTFCLGSSIAAQCFVLKTAQRSTAMLHGCCSTVCVLQEVNAKLDTAGTVYMVAA